MSHALLVRAAGDEAALERLRGDVLTKSYVDYFELPMPEQVELGNRLEKFAEELALPLRNVVRRRKWLWRARLSRVAFIVLVLILTVGVARRVSAWAEQRLDLARGAQWTTSSTGWSGGCRSPEQSCVGGETYFFHTNLESNPWVMFDLGERKTISSINVEHRPDCCPERAVPFVISVSVDKRTWKQVARRDEPFWVWKAEFQPVRARWVKLEVAKVSILHLASVRIYP